MAPKPQTAKDSAEMTFFEHLDALRPHLVRGALAVLVVGVAVFSVPELNRFVIDYLLFGPSQPDFPSNRALTWIGQLIGSADFEAGTHEFHIINTRMAGQFNLLVTVSLVSALVVAIPYLTWEIWRFVRPGLTCYERQKTNKFVFYVSLCFFAGLLFGYYVITPLAVNFLTGWVASPVIVNMIDAGSYLKTVITTSLAFALIFQLPILIYFLTRMGIVSTAFLRKYRRHAIIVLAVVSALITPPDLLSMILVVLPLIGLYELSVKISARVEASAREENEILYGESPDPTAD